MTIKPIIGEVKAQPINDNFSYITQQIINVTSGSPKGTYASLSALQAAYPNGAVGVYVVTTDGKWYYWNGTTWTAGGVYQSTGLPDNATVVKDFTGDGPIIIDKDFFDNFDRPNTTSGLGGNYTVNTDVVNPTFNWGILDGKAYSPNIPTGELLMALYDRRFSEVSVKADITMTGGTVSFPGITLNFVNKDNFIMFRGDSNTSIKIIKKGDGVYATLAQLPFNFTTGQTVAFEFTRLGNRIDLYADGVLVGGHNLSGADATKFNGTKHGMLVKDKLTRVDNLVIKTW